MNSVFVQPPLVQNNSGETRTAGFEIEFGAEDCVGVSKIIKDIFGGQLEKINPHYYKILDSKLGTFSVQLDTQFAHPELHEEGDEDKKDIDVMLDGVKEKLCEVIGDIGKAVVPYEVITAPIPINRLDELNSLVEGLEKFGVEGTKESMLYAFGVHINPEAPSLKPESILNHLRAFLLLSDWLHETMEINITRQLSPYIDTFPLSYALKILSPNYCPDLDELIDDYLDENPTRNRELDLLPLFTHLDKSRVQSRLDDGLTSARPTYHYRLPDCRLNDPNWSLAEEWNLWARVEKLADSPSKLKAMSKAYIANFEKLVPGNWCEEVQKWMSD